MALPPLSDHRCFLIYPLSECQYPPQDGLTLGNLASFVSRVGMHNEANRALRKVFGLDWMLDELNHDSARIDSYMAAVAAHEDEQRAKDRECRFHWATALGVLGVTWLSLFSGLKEILAIEAIASFRCIPVKQSGLYAVGVSLVFALIAAGITYRKVPAKGA
jgi:hypothetical protein